MYLKIHNIPGQGEVIAACDRELPNTTLTCPTCDVIINPGFYGGAIVASANTNIIGKRVCDLTIAAGLIDQESRIMMGDGPHAKICGRRP